MEGTDTKDISKEDDKKLSLKIPLIIGASFIGFLSLVKYVEWKEYTGRCHDNVQNSAIHQAEIVSTEKMKINNDQHTITGHAKLQNGFGAWSNYTYTCVMDNQMSRDVYLEEGYVR
ncbi:hypothetical protein [Cobetia marina]|uniref:hypothetical protein n=1 Tax=Cobetia marina TaxID=28258 RepID=UPI003A8D73A7